MTKEHALQYITEELPKAKRTKPLKGEDARLLSYLDSFTGAGASDRHNRWEVLSVVRFLKHLQQYDFRTQEIKRFVALFENSPFTGGLCKLSPVQYFQVANILGFYLNGTNKRLCREAILFVPRKFGKTTLIAGFAVYDFLLGDPNAQAYVGSNSYTQSQICFREIKQVLKGYDPAGTRFRVNREQVYSLDPARPALARCLANSPDKLDGLNASLVILDEYAQADSASLKNVLTSSMGTRSNPLTLIITTASPKTDAPFAELLEYYKAVLNGDKDDPRVFCSIFQPDDNDPEDSPTTWKKVQPHIGITIQEDYYPLQWSNAQKGREEMQEFRCKLLNIFDTQDGRKWVTRDQVESRYSTITENDKLQSTTVTAVDLSICDDLSAVTFLHYLPTRRIQGRAVPFHAVTKFYFPKGQLTQHPRGEFYKRMAQRGYIQLLEGDVIDYEHIAQELLNTPFVQTAIGYDSYKSREFVNILRDAVGSDRSLFPIPQTYGQFTSCVDSFELAFYQNRITFEENPLLAQCFDNCVIDEDRLENRKPIKRNRNDKIDGAITVLMCFWLLNNVTV